MRHTRISVGRDVRGKLSEAATESVVVRIPDEPEGVESSDTLAVESPGPAVSALVATPATELETVRSGVPCRHPRVPVGLDVAQQEAKPELPARCRLLDQADLEGRSEVRSDAGRQVEVDLWRDRDRRGAVAQRSAE